MKNKSKNTTIQAHSGHLNYVRSIIINETHKVNVFVLDNTNTLVYQPVYWYKGTWYAYTVNGKAFASFVERNAKRMILGH